MLDLEKAIENSLELIKQLDSKKIDLINSEGHFNSSNVISPVDLPGFDNSAMDGFAIINSDLKQATKSKPKSLECIDISPAGTFPNKDIKSGTCIRVFTGSPIPMGANAVIMQEDCNIQKNNITIKNQVKPWDNIRIQGEDIRKGDKLISKGEKINAGIIGLLSAVGYKTIEVIRQPRVGLIATGSELIEPKIKLSLGKIYESNRTMLAAMVKQSNALPTVYPIVKDDLKKTVSALKTAFAENDLIITSGGVSVGDHDYIKAAFKQIGGKINFWKVSIKPGKPIMVGQINRKILFGLPGNPISALITFLLIVRPSILKLQGAKNCHLKKYKGILKNEIINNGNRRHFVRVKLNEDSYVSILGNQRSHMLSGLPETNGLIDMPPNSRLANGEKVEVLLIPD